MVAHTLVILTLRKQTGGLQTHDLLGQPWELLFETKETKGTESVA